MVNKILASFVLADFLFAVGGAIMLGFAVIVQQTCFNAPTEGVEAARNLLYREFPFNGRWRGYSEMEETKSCQLELGLTCFS